MTTAARSARATGWATATARRSPMATPRPMGSGPRSSPRPRPGRSRARRSGVRSARSDGDGARAIAVEPGAAAMTGRSMPPRCTTKPNEIPADSTRIRIAATVAFGTAPDRLAAFGSSSAAVPLRYRGQSACAARRQTSSCWRADCGRGSPIAAQRLPSSGLRSGATRSPSSSNRKNGQTAGSGERAASSRIDSGGRGAGGGAATWADPASGGADPASGPASASPSAGVVGQSLRFNPPGELEPRTPRPRGV